MTVRALEQGCPIEFARCYFEFWMLRLSGVLPDLFLCSVCSRTLEIGEERFLAPGLQSVICGSCDHRNAGGMLTEVIELAQWILRNSLEPSPGPSGLPLPEGEGRALRNLHELNEYWIRHYSER